MKNKWVVCLFLLMLIIMLSMSTVFYYMYLREKKRNTVAEPAVSEAVVHYPNTFSDIENYVLSTNKRMIVIGKTGCSFCNLFTPVLKEAAQKYSFEYMYFDIRTFSDEEYNKFLNNEILYVPAKCNASGEKIFFKDGFSTPLTLFLENGEIYDCIRGYKDSAFLYDALLKANFIQKK